jgi:hypothetical protein
MLHGLQVEEEGIRGIRVKVTPTCFGKTKAGTSGSSL